MDKKLYLSPITANIVIKVDNICNSSPFTDEGIGTIGDFGEGGEI